MIYKTPGVYVEEISLFPPSIAQVATAIPAFIGYTEKAKFKGKTLAEKPVEVASLIEFEACFGRGSTTTITRVVLNDSNVVENVTTSTSYLLYESIRLYFANGGGRCYIVSVGQYGKTPQDAISKTALAKGLAVIAKEDEPTLLLFPDAIRLSGTRLYSLQRAALKQAAELGDRFVIMDLLEQSGTTAKEEYQEFRTNIGINNLAFGAAYTPYLEAVFPKEVRYRNCKKSLFKFGGQVHLSSLTEEPGVKETISSLEQLINDDGKLHTVINAIKGTSSSLNEAYQKQVATFKKSINDPAATDTQVVTSFKVLCTFCYNILDQIFDNLAAGSTVQGTGSQSLRHVLDASFSSEFSGIARMLDSYIRKLNSYLKEAGDAVDWSTVVDSVPVPPKTFQWSAGTWLAPSERGNSTADSLRYGTGTVKKQFSRAESEISALFKKLSSAVAELQIAAGNLEKEMESQLLRQMPVYKNIVSAINSDLSVLPPCGAIAGVYCTVDANRGVWKAPANVSLSTVSGLTRRIDDREQEGLNVDVNTGKSINALRSFNGRGTLVWGARTLAGNDNEWRYISVRRFFNMVEESVKKSTSWVVFEPNDAALWDKVKTMIENYLVLKWRDGALAGAKPEEAFYVHVGLGITMTREDILNGRLMVEIGMAVVRPAEFIVLRFMHKMQES